MTAPLTRCVYCGAPSKGPVCRAHSDLLALDPGNQTDREADPKKAA